MLHMCSTENTEEKVKCFISLFFLKVTQNTVEQDSISLCALCLLRVLCVRFLCLALFLS